jgi:hypothetical protein
VTLSSHVATPPHLWARTKMQGEAIISRYRMVHPYCATVAITMAPNPKLQSAGLMTRVRALQTSALQTHKCSLIVNQNTRDRNLAQSFHICHMYLHNYFKHQRPRHKSKLDNRTIDWDYLSREDVTWALIDKWKFEILYTKDGRKTQISPSTGKWVERPDKELSGRRMAAFLNAHNVKSMAAPGIDGCGEPCSCGGKASKHITGQACDLSGLDTLEKALQRERRSLDDYLKDFYLHRPLAHMEGKSRENWHVESVR